MLHPIRSCLLLALALWAGPALADGPNQRVGERVQLRPQDLPPPHATPSANNSMQRSPRPGPLRLNLPPGFQVNAFAEGLGNARTLLVAPNGDIFLAEMRGGRITILRDADGTGRASIVRIFADGLSLPHGLAIHGDYLYVGEVGQVRRIPYRYGELQPSGPIEAVTAPGSFGRPGNHVTRNIAFAPDGNSFFVSIGSQSNVAEDPSPAASIQRFNADGTGQRTYAAGTRNPIGIHVHPTTGVLWTVVNERDRLGDGLVPDYLTAVNDGDFFGWPYAYTGTFPDPDYGSRRPDLVARSRVPDLLFKAHSAPIDFAFYDGTQFPAEYRGNAFVTLQGSWNSNQPTGYALVRVPFENGKPKGYYEMFASGFWFEGTTRARVWGTPSGIAVAKDGSLLVADDTSNAIWRISYPGGQ